MALKMKKFCKITLYIEQTNPKLAEAISNVCLFGRPFSPAAHETGITFLYPDSNYQKEIIKNAVDNPELAHKMVRALIISGYFPTPSDFNAVGQVSNRLGQVVDIKEASSKEVIFGNGATASVDPKFQAMAMGRDNKVRLAVYSLKGRIPVDGSPAIQDKSRKKQGGYDYETGSFNRDMFMKRLEDDYTHRFFATKDDGKPTNKLINPYLEKLVSLLCHVQNESDLYNKVLGLVDYGVQASMYILIEPYRSGGNNIIPDDVLTQWKESGYPKIPNALDVFKTCLESIEDHSECIKKINAVRSKLMDGSECTPWGLSKALVQAYKDNPDEYKTDPLLKMQQDEIRFVVQTDFDDLEIRRKVDVQYGLCRRSDLRDLFKSIQASHNLNKTKTEHLLIMQQNRYDASSQPKGLFFDGSFAFLRSSAFLYHSVNPDQADEFEDSNAENPSFKGKISLFNRRLDHVENEYENRSISSHSILLQVKGLLLSPSAEQVKSQLLNMLQAE